MKLTRLTFSNLLAGKLWRRRLRNKSVLMYRILNNRTAPNLKDLFTRNNELQVNYDLRSRCTDLALPNPKREFLKIALGIVVLNFGIVFLLKQN